MTQGKRRLTTYYAAYMCRLLFKAEVFGSIVIANILHNLTEAGQFLCGVLSAFDQATEHLAEYSSVILVAGICKERAAVRKHTYGLRNKTYLHERFKVLAHTVLLIEEPPSRADLYPALYPFLLEAAGKYGQSVVVAGVEAIEDSFGKSAVLIEFAEECGEFFHINRVLDCVVTGVGTDFFQHTLGIIAESADMILLIPALLCVLLAEEDEHVALVFVLLFNGDFFALHTL